MEQPNFETQDKFPHLGEIPPHIAAITEINPYNINNDHLWVLRNHLGSLELKFPEIAKAVAQTREKVENAMKMIPNTSWEIMKAANDPSYRTNIPAANDPFFKEIYKKAA